MWNNTLQVMCEVRDLVVVDRQNFTFHCPSVCAGATLYCYCACRVPYDATRWILAVAPQIDDRHDPRHAIEFRFPFHLPLYPDGDVVFVSVSLEDDIVLPFRPLYLADLPPVPIRTVHPLTVKDWSACEAKWTSAFGNTCAVLSAAFDNVLDCTIRAETSITDGDVGISVSDSDAGAFVSTDAIEEVDYDLDVVSLNTSLLLARRGTEGTASDDMHASTVVEDGINDDEDSRIDVHTGLVASSRTCTDDNDEDDDMESIDGDTDGDDAGEDEDDDDEDDEEDDDVVE